MAAPMTAAGWRAGTGLASPPRQVVQQTQAIVQYQQPTAMQTWSDGSRIQLRHAPRRQKGTKDRLPVPGTPASVPMHWMEKTRAGHMPKPEPKETVPDFGTWKKDSAQRRRDRIRASLYGDRPVGAATPVPVQPVPATPGMLPMRRHADRQMKMELSGEDTPYVPSRQGGDATPVMPQADGTPFFLGHRQQPVPQHPLGGDTTPFLPRPNGDMTPIGLRQGGDETPIVAVGMSGEDTPYIPFTPNAEQVAGITPMHGGFMTPQAMVTAGYMTPQVPV